MKGKREHQLMNVCKTLSVLQIMLLLNWASLLML